MLMSPNHGNKKDYVVDYVLDYDGGRIAYSM